MNIFATNKCPVKSAKNLDDIRVTKMVLESAQMLSTAANYYGATTVYKPTHKNHPCNVWVRESRSNYMWLYNHFLALLDEFSLRRNKTHACAKLKAHLKAVAKFIPAGELTPFANCARRKDLNIDFTHVKDVHKAYSEYIVERWKNDIRPPKFYGEVFYEQRTA